MIDDIFDGLMGEGVYARPFWDGHQHHVAGRRFTTRELCAEVREILHREPLRTYLAFGHDVVVRYFISWYENRTSDMPLYVWVDEEDGVRLFFYETFKGDIRRFVVRDGMSIPQNAFEASQMAMRDAGGISEKRHVKVIRCMMGSCSNNAVRTVTIKSGASIEVCDEHLSGIQEQISKVEKAKAAKLAVRKSRGKKMTEGQARKIIASEFSG